MAFMTSVLHYHTRLLWMTDERIIMGVKNFIKNAFNNTIESIETKKAFKSDKRSIHLLVFKGNRDVVISIFDETNNCFYLLEDKTTNVNDILVTEREKQYKVIDVKNAQISLIIDNQNKSIDVVALICEPFLNDPHSLVNSIQINQTANSNFVFNIENMNDSSISNFGNIVNKIDFTQDIEHKWSMLKHDLDYRFHYKEYKKYIELVDQTIAQKKILLKLEIAEKVARIAGSFLGEIIKGFTAALLEKYGGQQTN